MRNLHDLLPSFFTEVYEFDEILKSQQEEIDMLFTERYKFFDNLFLSTADSDGLDRYEAIYEIVKGVDQSLEERRYIIKTAMTDKRPMTLNYLKKFLTGICGEGEFEISLENYTLSIDMTLPNTNIERAVTKFIENAIPANLVLEIVTDYSTVESMQYQVGDE
ncbi:MAG: putative phage tail protein [Clostridia bacterium]